MVLVGAVGIENTTGRNFKELEGILGNVKALKRRNGKCKGILIGPLMTPRFSLARSNRKAGCGSNFAARMANRLYAYKLNLVVKFRDATRQ
jgi:hypothetical protein